MPVPNPKRQREAHTTLGRIFSDAAHVWVIHYSCESFYDRAEGRSPRVTSIALRKLDSGQTVSFSIHKVAERRRLPFAEIEAHYDDLERQMLDEFYVHIGSHRGMRYLHWNMRDGNYGFAAIEHRYRVLGGEPVVVEDERKHDLARLLIDIYGVAYAAHPRLERLLRMNDIQPRDFLSGKLEAEAFETQNFVALHQSTLRKVDVLADIARRAHDRDLKTNTGWWEMRGGGLRAAYAVVVENKGLAFLGTALTIGGTAYAIWSALGPH